jgi:hypothetical protein
MNKPSDGQRKAIELKYGTNARDGSNVMRVVGQPDAVREVLDDWVRQGRVAEHKCTPEGETRIVFAPSYLVDARNTRQVFEELRDAAWRCATGHSA